MENFLVVVNGIRIAYFLSDDRATIQGTRGQLPMLAVGVNHFPAIADFLVQRVVHSAVHHDHVFDELLLDILAGVVGDDTFTPFRRMLARKLRVVRGHLQERQRAVVVKRTHRLVHILVANSTIGHLDQIQTDETLAISAFSNIPVMVSDQSRGDDLGRSSGTILVQRHDQFFLVRTVDEKPAHFVCPGVLRWVYYGRLRIFVKKILGQLFDVSEKQFVSSPNKLPDFWVTVADFYPEVLRVIFCEFCRLTRRKCTPIVFHDAKLHEFVHFAVAF